jgi:hypothetical protein
MRYSLIGFLILLLFPVFLSAQDDGGERRPFKKLEKLEQIKLIEALKMNEETSVRFFARQQESKKKIREYDKQSRDCLLKMKKILDEKPDKNCSDLKKLSDEYMKLLVKMQKERMSFINSLSDILSTEQIARLILFEKNFREEIRNLLFNEKFRDKK